MSELHTYSLREHKILIKFKPETNPQVRVELRKRLHLDLERVERLSDVDGGRGAEGARHEVDGHMLRVLLGGRVLLHAGSGRGDDRRGLLQQQSVGHMASGDERGSCWNRGEL